MSLFGTTNAQTVFGNGTVRLGGTNGCTVTSVVVGTGTGQTGSVLIKNHKGVPVDAYDLTNKSYVDGHVETSINTLINAIEGLNETDVRTINDINNLVNSEPGSRWSLLGVSRNNQAIENAIGLDLPDTGFTGTNWFLPNLEVGALTGDNVNMSVNTLLSGIRDQNLSNKAIGNEANTTLANHLEQLYSNIDSINTAIGDAGIDLDERYDGAITVNDQISAIVEIIGNGSENTELNYMRGSTTIIGQLLALDGNLSTAESAISNFESALGNAGSGVLTTRRGEITVDGQLGALDTALLFAENVLGSTGQNGLTGRRGETTVDGQLGALDTTLGYALTTIGGNANYCVLDSRRGSGNINGQLGGLDTALLYAETVLGSTGQNGLTGRFGRTTVDGQLDYALARIDQLYWYLFTNHGAETGPGYYA